MAKLTLTDIGSLSNPSSAEQAINDNFTAIETAMENTLSRDGTTPNQMTADIDMNSNDLLNAQRVDAVEFYKNGVPFEQSVAYANKQYQILSGTGAQTDFTLLADPGSLGNLYVSVGGSDLKPGLDYNYDGTTISFTVAPALGTDNIYIRYDVALATEDSVLRQDLGSEEAAKGSALVVYNDTISAAPYLQTVSDIINGSEVSLHRFIPKAQLPAIRAGTSTYDAGDAIRTAFADVGVLSLLVPYGRHNYSGNLPRNAGLALRGESSRHSVLRCIGSGGIVFTGGPITDAFTFPTLDLSDLRILAAIPNAGTAVTMSYTGGSGIAALGPRWNNVAIEAEEHGEGFNIGVRGTNVRDFRIVDVTVAGSNGNPGYPANYLMDHGFLMDGNDDPVELWFTNLYGYYLKQAVEISGQYEGIYVDHAHTVAMHHFLKWDSTTPNPVAMISDSYIASERSGVDLDRVSYFRIQNNVFNPTAPVPDANYTGILVRRSTGGQTQASEITENSFVGVGYSSTTAFTETACHLVNANTVAWRDNTVYDMDVGIVGTAGEGNRIGPGNRYIAVTTQENVPAAMRSGHLSPECVAKMSRNASNQSVLVNNLTQVIFDTVTRDDRGYYNAGTGAFTPPAGHYRVKGRLRVSDAVVGDFVGAYITVGGAAVEVNGMQTAVAGAQIVEVNGTVEVNGSQAIAIAVNVETGVGGPTRTVFAQNIATLFEVEAITG